MLGVLVTQSLDVAVDLFILAAIVGFVAVILLIGSKQWPKASSKAPIFVALALVILAIGLVFFA